MISRLFQHPVNSKLHIIHFNTIFFFNFQKKQHDVKSALEKTHTNRDSSVFDEPDQQYIDGIFSEIFEVVPLLSMAEKILKDPTLSDPFTDDEMTEQCFNDKNEEMKLKDGEFSTSGA